MHFAQPGWLWLLILMPLPWLLERARPRIAWPSLDGFPRQASHRLGLAAAAAGPACAGWRSAALAVALARPQTVGGVTRIAGQGVAIVVALDQSSSMNAARFPDRPGHADDLAAGGGQDDVHAVCRGAIGRPDRPGRLRQLSRAGLPADPRPRLPARDRGERASRRGPGTTAPTSAMRSPWVSMRSWSRPPRRRCSCS